jgi:hypothetical protein
MSIYDESEGRRKPALMHGRPALHKMQEILGENAGEIGQQHLRFVRRGVCCCSAVARESSLATVALLGRFLPRLGPLPQGERPLSFSVRVSSAAHFFIHATQCLRVALSCSPPIRPQPRDTDAILRAEFPRADQPRLRIRQQAWRKTVPAGNGAHPYIARG